MKKKQPLASHGDLFLFPKGELGYISDIVWQEKEQVYVYTITVRYNTDVFSTAIKAGNIKEYAYHENSVRSFIENNQDVVYYPVVK